LYAVRKAVKREDCQYASIPSSSLHTFRSKKRMLLARLFLAEVPAKAIKKLHSFTDEVLADYFSYFRQLISTSLKEEDTRIGGPGIIVEIDETKLGKG
jgi:hypothetical protein